MSASRSLSRAPVASGCCSTVCSAYEQAATLMKHDLMHPDLYFDVWPDPSGVWKRVETIVRGIRADGNPRAYTGVEWLAARSEEWRASQAE